jgi:hypothetical protein
MKHLCTRFLARDFGRLIGDHALVSLGPRQMHFLPGTVVVDRVEGAWTYGQEWSSEAGDVGFEVAGPTHSPRMVGKENTLVFLVIEGRARFCRRCGQDGCRGKLADVFGALPRPRRGEGSDACEHRQIGTLR